MTTPAPLKQAWYGMRRRCFSPTSPCFENYGGRGITVCERWRDSFDAFAEDMGEPPPGTSLDRINNDGNYEPANCRWADKFEQARNRSDSVKVTAFGRTQVLYQWAQEVGMDHKSLRARLASGMTPEQALTMPRRVGLRLITAFGKTQSIADWARESGIAGVTITSRLNVGKMTNEEAVSRPPANAGARSKGRAA